MAPAVVEGHQVPVRNLARMRAAARDRDIVYVPSGLTSFLSAWAGKGRARLVGGPNVAGIPGLMPVEHPSPLMTDRMSARWVAMSPVWRDHLRRSGSRPETPDLVPHAVNSATFTPALRDPAVWAGLGLRPSSHKVVHSGHIDPEGKGVRHIVKAHQSLVTGDAFARHLASADLLVGASRWETFWLAPLEAMSCGMPILVSGVGAVPLIVPQDGGAGFLMDMLAPDGAYRPDADLIMARRMAEALSDPDRLRRVGAAGRARAEAEFSIATPGERLAACFHKALSRSSGPSTQARPEPLVGCAPAGWQLRTAASFPPTGRRPCRPSMRAPVRP